MKIHTSLLTTIIVISSLSLFYADGMSLVLTCNFIVKPSLSSEGMLGVGSETTSSQKPIRRWPSLIGTQAKFARKEINIDRPDLHIYVVPKVCIE